MSYTTWGQNKQTCALGRVPFWPASFAHSCPPPYPWPECFSFSFHPWEILMIPSPGFSQSIVFSFFSLLTFWIMCLASVTLLKTDLDLPFSSSCCENEGGTPSRWATVWTKDSHVDGDIDGEVSWLRERREDSSGSSSESFMGYW